MLSKVTTMQKAHQKCHSLGVLVVAQWKQIKLGTMRLWVRSWACSVGWRSGVALSCGIGCRLGLNLALLWPWHRPAATAPMRPLTWEPPYAAGTGPKRTKGEKKKMSLSLIFLWELLGSKHWISFYLLLLNVIGVLESVLVFNCFIIFQSLSFHVLSLLFSLLLLNSNKHMLDFGTVFLSSLILSFVFSILLFFFLQDQTCSIWKFPG